MVLLDHLLQDSSKRFIKSLHCFVDSSFSAHKQQDNDVFVFSNSKIISTEVKHHLLHFHKIDH